MSIKELVKFWVYTSRVSRVEKALVLRKLKSAYLFPTDRNKERKKGQRISQGETLTSITCAPEIALSTNKEAIVKISAKTIFFNKKV